MAGRPAEAVVRDSPVNAPQAPGWSEWIGDAALVVLCLWTWIAPFGPQPGLFRFLCFALMVDLMTRGPLLLGAMAARGGGRLRLLPVLMICAIAGAALWMFGLGSGAGIAWALLAIGVFGGRLFAAERALRRPDANPTLFVAEHLLALFALFGLLIATMELRPTDFGHAWPSPRALGFASDDPQQWIAHPPRVLFAGSLYFGILVALRAGVQRYGRALMRRGV